MKGSFILLGYVFYYRTQSLIYLILSCLKCIVLCRASSRVVASWCRVVNSHEAVLVCIRWVARRQTVCLLCVTSAPVQLVDMKLRPKRLETLRNVSGRSAFLTRYYILTLFSSNSWRLNVLILTGFFRQVISLQYVSSCCSTSTSCYGAARGKWLYSVAPGTNFAY